MTDIIIIEPNVLIWTVLSFCALAFILNKFLFKPILKVMDERQSKIDKFHTEKQARLEENDAKRQAAEEERANAQKEAIASGEKALEKEKAKTEKELNKAKEKYDGLLDERRNELLAESENIETQLDAKIDELALAYATALLK